MAMIKRELAMFLIVGCLTVLIDFLTYHALIRIGVVGVNFAKGGGFMVGTAFAYFANRFWTFGHTRHRPGSSWRFGFLYLMTLSANVIINALLLKLLIDARSAVHFAFVFATGISASINFLGMKWFVFGARRVAGLR